MKPTKIIEVVKWVVLPITAVIGVPPVASALFGVQIVDWRWVWNGAGWIAVSAVLFVAGRLLERREARAEAAAGKSESEAATKE